MKDPAHFNEHGAHRESLETYQFIADWVDPKFFFSKKDVWHRFGFLGVFADYVLSCTPGDVMEIGTGESSIYLSHVARKYNRKFMTCDIAPGKICNVATVDGYLKIGQEDLQLVEGSRFEDGRSLFYVGPSDDFFIDVNPQNLAVSFIDGDHLYGQVKKDFGNCVFRTVDNGYILLHDTHPPSEDYTREERCGTVYRLRQEIEKDPRFDCLTLPVGTAIGVGLTIVRVKPRGPLPEYQQ